MIVRDPDTGRVEQALAELVTTIRGGVRLMDVVLLGPGTPARCRSSPEALAQVGARVIGVGDQPPDALPDVARASLSAYVQIALVGRRGRCTRNDPRRAAGQQRRPGRVAVGADHAAGRTPPRGDRRARADGRADHSVPGQGAHEGGAEAAGIRTPRSAAQLDGRRGAGRPPSGSATRSSSSRSPAPARWTPTASTNAERAGRRARPARPHPRGQRRGVHRRRRAHLRHGLRRRARSRSTTSAGTGRGRWSASRSSGSPSR